MTFMLFLFSRTYEASVACVTPLVFKLCLVVFKPLYRMLLRRCCSHLLPLLPVLFLAITFHFLCYNVTLLFKVIVDVDHRVKTSGDIAQPPPGDDGERGGHWLLRAWWLCVLSNDLSSGIAARGAEAEDTGAGAEDAIIRCGLCDRGWTASRGEDDAHGGVLHVRGLPHGPAFCEMCAGFVVWSAHVWAAPVPRDSFL